MRENIVILITPLPTEKIIRKTNNKIIKCDNCDLRQFNNLKKSNGCCLLCHNILPIMCSKCNVEQIYNIKHCEKCDCCVTLSEKHKCAENRLDGNCPICLEKYINSDEDIIISECGHDMHKNCYSELTKNTPKCPVCYKLMFCFKEYDNLVDELIDENLQNDAQLEFKKIICNECAKCSDTIYHEFGYKCFLCGSYNTKLY